MAQNSAVHVRFLLGSAGTGKTFRCLSEVRTELQGTPAGPPLIFLAPKQATFQIERQLLGTAGLPGYTRLQILSFERLAGFILVALGRPQPRLLDDDGRLMVLRALLTQHHERLELFRASARLPGFAQQLSGLLREFQRARIGPSAIDRAAAQAGTTALARKLRDLAFLFREYLAWLAAEKIEDADRLLDIAADALREASAAEGVATRFGGLWLDGFAEMTEQELALLQALLPWCARATLAFCCEPEELEAGASFSPWSVIAHTARRCLHAVNAVAPEVVPEAITGVAGAGRFGESAALAHLQSHWATPAPFAEATNAIRLVQAGTPEDEATFAAREILSHVQAGGRFREVAVLVRQLEPYQDIVRRVFTRYGIPHFIDQREAIAHHPLAELTRYAVRTAALGWRQDDWLGLLKSGLTGVPELDADWLENEALARGWEGRDWLESDAAANCPELAPLLGRVRERLAAPLHALEVAFAKTNSGGGPTGLQLAASLRGLWRTFGVQEQLEAWAREATGSAVHATVWDQMEQWLHTMGLGFGHQRVPIREWLPIIEAGLAGLSVGVIPPVLDEVLVGSIDRSRNPDLQSVFLLGVNEGVFPAPPSDPVLLTEIERAQLAGSLTLGVSVRQQLAHERFYGYIACTRARRKLFVTWSEADRLGRQLNPSAFIPLLQRLFPQVATEAFIANGPVRHASELVAPLLRVEAAGTGVSHPLLALKAFDPVRTLIGMLREPATTTLTPATVTRLYQRRLATSISRLEQFASCPFQFFVRVGLRAQERVLYEVDARHTGTFQHEVLKAFHEEVRARFGNWHAIPPAVARALIREIAERLRTTFQDGLLVSSDRNRVESAHLISALEDFIEVIVTWMSQYAFEPHAVELGFGREDGLPAWELALDAGRTLAFSGSIDRVDLLVDRANRTAYSVVMDYKSTARTVDPRLLAAGVQLQLFAYLAATRGFPAMARHFDVDRIEPAGAFYVPLRGAYDGAGHRDEALADPGGARRVAYRHRGRFRWDLRAHFHQDIHNGQSGDQFAFRAKKDGGFHGGDRDPMEHAQFDQLLDQVEQQLVAMGNAIFAGDIGVNPYRVGNKTPCEHCDYAAVCRIDPWTHEYRALPKP